MSKNVGHVLKYQKIYVELLNHKIPILKEMGRKKKIKNLNMAKNCIMVSGLVFFLMYSKIGILNRMMIGLIATNMMTFVAKGYFYSKVVEDAAEELSLVGQETRIQLR